MIYYHCVRSLRFHPLHLSLSWLHFFYKENHFNYSLHSSLNRTMPENDQPQADESPLTTWIKRHLVSLNHDESTVGERSDFQTVATWITGRLHEMSLRELRVSPLALSRPSTVWLKGNSGNLNKIRGEYCGKLATFQDIQFLHLHWLRLGHWYRCRIFVVTRSMKFKIRASNAINLSYNSFSAQSVREKLYYLPSQSISFFI